GGQRRGIRRRLHAASTGTGVAFNQRTNLEVRRRKRRRNARGCLATVEHQGQPRAARQRDQPLQLLPPDDIVGDENVVDAGVCHHFGFTELLTGDADGTKLDLSARELRYLVGLDVGSQGETFATAVVLSPRQIAVDSIEVDGDAGRVEIVDGPG